MPFFETKNHIQTCVRMWFFIKIAINFFDSIRFVRNSYKSCQNQGDLYEFLTLQVSSPTPPKKSEQTFSVIYRKIFRKFVDLFIKNL